MSTKSTIELIAKDGYHIHIYRELLEKNKHGDYRTYIEIQTDGNGIFNIPLEQ